MRLITRFSFAIFSLAIFSLPSLPLLAETQLFSLNNVRLLPSPFYEAQQTDLNYLLALDADKLLAPYRREAKLPLIKESYGNWESGGLDGHIGGHYVSALSMMFASTGDARILQRLNYMMDELEKCQRANGDGYLGGMPDSKASWQKIRQGELVVENFSINGKWVPWYNLHKMFAGLRDAYQIAGNQKAKKMLIDFADWADELSSHLNDEQMQTMLRSEQGGMNEVFADVSTITGDKKYLTLAKRFSHRGLLEPLTKEHDELTGLHANAQIPKVIGYEKIGLAAKDDSYLTAAKFFWDTVVDHRTLSMGGNSVREHFNDVHDYSSLLSEIAGPETCNTYNMLKLTELLFRYSNSTQEKIRYTDYYERALYNHILSSQHPETGGFVYYTSLRPNHYRTYSRVDHDMWCCVGAGIENHAKYGEFIYAHQDKRLLVNLFIPSHLSWKEEAVELRQRNSFPDQSTTELQFETANNIELAIRYPSWVAADQLKIRVNGKPQKITAHAGDYVLLKRHWKKNDVIQIELPMALHLEQMPDQSNYYSVLFGPIVLAAKTNPIANEKFSFLSGNEQWNQSAMGLKCPLESSPMLVADSLAFEKSFKPVVGKSLTFTADNVIRTQNSERLELIPFFRLHDSRYVLYWPYSTEKNYDAFKAQIAAKEKFDTALAAITIDQIVPGEQQPEVDHHFKAEASESGLNGNRHWRHTSAWLSYELFDEKAEAKSLRVEYATADAGRSFDIFVNDIKIATQVLEKNNEAEFYSVDYLLPPSVLKNLKGKWVVKFVAHRNSVAGDFYDVRLLRSATK